MPTLDWIGKSAIVNHHQEIPYRLLHSDEMLSFGDPGQGNLLVEGDNLHALKALLPYYAGKIKCIYIDPPYNTGNEGWVYNDNVNSPEIRKWLGQVVGEDDLSRHDKWLCMMYPRLALLWELLQEDGILFVQIGDEENYNLRCMLDDIFGSSNFRNAIIVRRGTKNVQSQFKTIDALSIGHDSILMYTKSRNTRLTKLQHNLGEDEHGKWDTFWRGTDRPTMRYELFGITPDNGQWRWSEERGKTADGNYQKFLEIQSDYESLDDYYVETLLERGLKLDFVRLNDDGVVQYYVPPRSYKILSDMWMDVSTRGTTTNFPHEKHTDLLRRIIGWVTNPEDIILDSFAGSGSTGQAVLQLNALDAGNRRFILVEMEPHICRNITSVRLHRDMIDDSGQQGFALGFRYCTLGEPLFDEQGKVRPGVRFPELARHIFFTETGEPLPEGARLDSPLIGVHNGTALYLLFNGILGDKSVNGGNVLTNNTLKSLPSYDGPRLIFGEGCRLSLGRLRREGISFKQIPYQVKVS